MGLFASWLSDSRNGETRLFDTDDLIQAGYLALMEAVQGYDPDAGMAFASYLVYHLRRHFVEVSGTRGAKRRPEATASSLDAPIDAEGDVTRLDLLADPDAYWAYDDAIEREGNRQDCAALMDEVDKLDNEARQVVELHICRGLTAKDTAVVMDTTPERVTAHRQTALRRLRHTPTARRLYRDYEVRHVSLSTFRTTHTSEQEAALLRWEEWEEQGRR